MRLQLFSTILIAPFVSAQQPADCPGGEAPLEGRATRDKYQCSFGACFPVGHTDENRPNRKCVHNAFMCGSDEEFVTALELHALPNQEPCFCEDILDYPSTIGICDYGGGILTPMVTQKGDCANGSPRCKATSGYEKASFFLKGDPRGVVGPAYTSCDLPCDAQQGHSLQIVQGEFEGCEFPKRDWVTGTVDDRSNFWGRAGAIQDDFLFIVGDIKATDPSATPENTGLKDNVVLRGPYTAEDPTAAQGSTVSDKVYYPDFSGYTDDDEEPRVFDDEIGLAIINKNTGEPIEVMHLGSNYHAENTWAVDAERISSTGELAVVLGGKFTGTITSQTQTCTSAVNDLATTSCQQNGNSFTTTMSVDVNPNLDLDSLPDSATADMGGMTTFVMALDMQDNPSSSMLRGVKWLVSPFSGTFNGNVRDVEIDSNGDVYVLGRECDGDPVSNPNPSSEDNCEVILTKLSAADGSALMTKRYSYLYHAYELEIDEDDGMLFFSSSMQDGAISDDGTFSCKNGVVPDEVCSVTMAVDLQGNLIWARTLDHLDLYGFFTGSIMVAHELDGPYVYVTYEESQDSLDQGTPYPICKNNVTGQKTPVYDISMNEMVTTCPSGSTYHAHDSTEAMPARAASTGAICSGTKSNSCAIKYHKYTGLPIFGAAVAAARALGVSPDGVLLAGSYYSETFSWAEQMAQTSLIGSPSSSVSYQALVDKDTGRGVYVQALAVPTGYAQTYSSVTDSEGNFYVIIGHNSNEMYADDFSLRLPIAGGGGWTQRHLLVEKYSTGQGGSTYVPSCISSCRNNNADNAIQDGRCYISNFCYSDKDSFALSTGEKCRVCDVSHSQKEAYEPPGCLEEGETYAPTFPGYASPAPAPNSRPTGPTSSTGSSGSSNSFATSENSGNAANSNELSKGAKAGIAVASVFGFGFVVILLLASTGRIGIGFVRRSSSNKSPGAAADTGNHPGEASASETGGPPSSSDVYA